MSLKKNELVDLFTFQSNGLNKSVINQILTPSGRGGIYASRDYISANAILAEFRKVYPDFDLSQIESKKQLFDMLHPSVRFRLKSYTPCLAARYDELKDADKKKIGRAHV